MSDSSERAIRYLAQSSLLRGVSEEILRALDPPPEIISLKSGEVLIRKGETNLDYFVLISGRLRAYDERDGQLVPLKAILPGDGVGEIALLTDEPRSATVIARLDSELVRFQQSSFLVLVAGHPMALLTMVRTAIARVKGQVESRTRLTNYPIITMLPLSPGIDTRALAQGLADELKPYGRSCMLDSGFAGVLDELEEMYDFMVLAAEPAAGEWSKFCLLRADLVLLVASVTDTSEPGEVERQFLQNTDRRVFGRIDLLLVHPQERRRSGAARWIDRLQPVEYHQARLGRTDDMSRLARIVAGRANNLVLSGGGARAFAQIGALRALKESNVPIDRVGGCSMGAAIAAMEAFDDGFEDMVSRFRELFLRKRPARDITIPLLSLLAGKKMTGIAHDLFADSRIEDLPRRYFCISCDLGTGDVVEHVDGPVWVALRATAAMPVVAPPLLKDDRVLVDGGVLNNLPVDVMKRRFTGKAIAVDVSSHEPLKVDHRWDLTCPSGFDVLRARINPFGPRRVGLPGIFEILRRTATLAGERQTQQNREQADLLISPPVQTFGVTEFDAIDRLIQIGYRHTLAILEKVKP